jgi:hypothetical protein
VLYLTQNTSDVNTILLTVFMCVCVNVKCITELFWIQFVEECGPYHAYLIDISRAVVELCRFETELLFVV